ncbi:hypothetical protein [Sphingobium sp. CCH11-B1]|jgi:hypothetical protein|uniref:hypothetical protein n=1 Tax=Sphingobium sp. CCH11-B1 TaxID=1768781 RepID=UPI000A75C00E|nr:hypothetical protein [Sphingobium sp. CCH11-B1]
MRGDVLGIGVVAIPINCNSAVELSGLFDAVRRTRVRGALRHQGDERAGRSRAVECVLL